jgi:hypothetical protein
MYLLNLIQNLKLLWLHLASSPKIKLFIKWFQTWMQTALAKSISNSSWSWWLQGSQTRTRGKTSERYSTYLTIKKQVLSQSKIFEELPRNSDRQLMNRSFRKWLSGQILTMMDSSQRKSSTILLPKKLLLLD